MAQLVGADRRAIVDRLVEHFDAVAAGNGPVAVSLESSLGLGKTRLAQELYHHLATSRQGCVAYWPASLDWREHADGDTRRDVLQVRKQVEPTPGWVVPGGVEIPWLWWGITCQLTHAGSPMRALKDASDQLRAHLDPPRSAPGRERAGQVPRRAPGGGTAGVLRHGQPADRGAR